MSISGPKNSTAIPERKDVSTELKWRLEDIYASDTLWEADMARLQEKLPELTSFQGRLGASARNLLDGLNLLNEIDEMAAKVGVYARMRKDEDNTDPKYQGMYERAASLAVQVMSAAAFIRPELLAVEDNVLEEYMASNPELELYRQFLRNTSRMRGSYIVCFRGTHSCHGRRSWPCHSRHIHYAQQCRPQVCVY